MVELTESRKKAIKRTEKLVYFFASFMLDEEAKRDEERETFEKAVAEGKQVMIVSCAENNIRCMHNCMKESVEVAKYLKNKEVEIEEWQLAGINAMYEACDKENGVEIPHDLPYVIKGLLLRWDNE